MVIKVKIKMYIKKFLPFLVLLVPFYASATRVTFDLTGTWNGNSISRSFYVNYETGVCNVSIDDNGDPVYDHTFLVTMELRQFTGNYIQYVSGIIRPYIKFDITSSDYISSYLEAPFYTEEKISASVEYLNLSSTQARFDVICTLDNYYVDSAIPLVQFNYHIVTSSTTIPALSNFALDYSSQSGNYYRLSTQDDLATIIAAAIDDSTDINYIISILSHISQQSDLLTSVLQHVTSLDSLMSQVLTHVNNIDGYDSRIITLLERLYYVFCGSVYPSNNSPGQDAAAFQAYWRNIIITALQNFYSDISPVLESRADQQNSSVQSAQEEVHSLEATNFNNLSNASGNIDWNVTSPSGIVTAATKILAFLDRIYARLQNIKFLITVSLTMGIIVLVLGSALHYYRRGR